MRCLRGALGLGYSTAAMIRSFRWLCVALLVTACGGLRSGVQEPDGSVSKVDSGAVDEADGGFPPAGNDAGHPPSDGGATPDGGLAPSFTWGAISVPSTQPLRGISGRGEGSSLELYVVTESKLLRFSGGRWTPALEVSGKPLSSVWAREDGAVFVVGSSLWSCLSNCTQTAAFKEFTGSLGAASVCGAGDHVYALGETGGGRGYLEQFDFGAQTWKHAVTDLGTAFAQGCWVSTAGHVFIAAQSNIHRYDGLELVREPLDYPGDWTVSAISAQHWRGVSGAGDSVYAVGTRRRVISRSATGRWSFAFDPDGVDRLSAVVVFGEGEVLAAGQVSPEAQRMARVSSSSSTQWSFDPAGPALSAAAAWAASPREVFIVGTAEDGLTGAMFRGTR